MTAVATHIADVVERPLPLGRRGVLAGLAAMALGLGGAVLGHHLVPQVGILTWAIGLGVLAGNIGVLPRTGTKQLGLFTKKLLRVGIVLLGFSVSFASITALGLPLIAVVAVSLVSTLVFTTWLGNRMGLSPARRLLIGTGTAICGASAIAAMEDTARGRRGGRHRRDRDGDPVRDPGSWCCFRCWPGPLGLSDMQFGIWAGASVHEVGQVVAAASPAGAAVVATAVVVKLTRVVMLAPVVAVVSVIQRVKSPAASTDRPGPRWCRCSCSASSPVSRCAAPAWCPRSCSARSPTSRSPPWVPPCSAWAAASRSPPCSRRAEP